MENNFNFEVLQSIEIEFANAADNQELQDHEEDEVRKEVPMKSCSISDLEFATALRHFGSVLLEKNQTPQIKKKKAEAVKEMAMHFFFIEKGIDFTEKQIMKKVNNMKTRIKAKTDKKAIGNRKISLNAGEKITYSLLGSAYNQAVTKVNYGISVGVQQRKTNDVSDDEEHPVLLSLVQEDFLPSLNTLENDSNLDQNLGASTAVDDIPTSPLPKIRRIKQTSGTNRHFEQKNLSTTQLQRMVLTKQLEALDQQMRINTKLEAILGEVGTVLNDYIISK